MKQNSSELETIEAELEFWRDFIKWWEKQHSQSVEKRVLETLANAEQRYRKFCEMNIDEDNRGNDLRHVNRVLN